MINPHNPEFITRRPWYLGGNDAGPSLDHQADQRTEAEKLELSMASADTLVQRHRQSHKQNYQKFMNGERDSIKWKKGMWVEAKKKNKLPYLICQITKYDKRKKLFWLQYEDGSAESKVKLSSKSKKSSLFKKSSESDAQPRIRLTKAGNRSFAIDHEKYGKETYDSKRDKYHGYDASSNQHVKMMEDKYSKRDAIRRKKKEQKLKQQNERQKESTKDKTKIMSDSDSDTDYDSDSSGSDQSNDEFVQHDEEDKMFTSRLARQGGVGGAQMKVTARNLRIREDTAKYLRNLDLNSAFYDPKSRSMRDNPNPDVDPQELQFSGDNFARISGDAVNLAKSQVFAWDYTSATKSDVHVQANPSQVELMKKKHDAKQTDLVQERKQKVLEKYGGSQYFDGGDGMGGSTLTPSVPSSSTSNKTSGETLQERKVRFGASVVNQEYSRDGRVLIPGQSSTSSTTKSNVYTKQTSKYEEDVFQNGHNTVWGSYFHVGAFRWGYEDDHSLMKNSYCTGINGRIANDDANELRYGTGEAAGAAELLQKRQMLQAQKQSNQNSQSNGTNKSDSNVTRSRSALYGEVDPNIKLDAEKVKEALKKQTNSNSTNNESIDDRKRKYNSIDDNVDVTKEEMEAYRLKKGRADDPMLKIDGDGLLEYK